MQLTTSAEEALESLWLTIVERKMPSCDIASLAAPPGVAAELESGGMVKINDGRATLTARGHAEAMGCICRHGLAERVLAVVLAVKRPLIHDTGCDFEHLLHRGLDESVCTLLGHPRTCPHGKPIPEGRCCREARTHARKLIAPLSDMKENDSGVVAYLHTADREALHKLLAIGVLPHTGITLVQRSPTIVFQIGRSQFAVDKELAAAVFVRQDQADGPDARRRN